MVKIAVFNVTDIAALNQKRKPAVFCSRLLGKSEQTQPSVENEAPAIAETLENGAIC